MFVIIALVVAMKYKAHGPQNILNDSNTWTILNVTFLTDNRRILNEIAENMRL